MRFIKQIERKLEKYAIKNMMIYIVAGNIIVFLADFIFADFTLSSMLLLSPSRILRGEIWRLVSFIFVPTSHSILNVAITLYLYYIIGISLENHWGSFRMNQYYLLGMLASVAASFITGFGVGAQSINLSLFLAFATLAPNMQLLLFFVLPVKVKWLGWIAWVWIAYNLVSVPGIATKILVLVPTVNYFIFFGQTIVKGFHRTGKSRIRKAKFDVIRPSVKNNFHKCTACGKTENDNPSLEFRYCSKCNGDYEYCSEHLRNHEHIG